MKITSSYAVEIKKQRMFDDTIKLYREAVSFLIDCFNKEWPAMVRSRLSAKVPEAERRIQVTLATLKVLYPEYQKLTIQAA